MSAVVADVLERAADVIVERGWCQDAYQIEGRCCALGAIRVVVGGTFYNRYQEAGEALGAYVHGIDPQDEPWPADWNDEPGRTADEVITALRECAAAERASP